jgi:hypothetical protein
MKRLNWFPEPKPGRIGLSHYRVAMYLVGTSCAFYRLVWLAWLHHHP